MTPIDRISLAEFSEPIDMTSEGPFVLYELEEDPEFLLANYRDTINYQFNWYRYGYFQDQNRDIIAASKIHCLECAGTAMNVNPELYATFLNGMVEQGLDLNGGETNTYHALLDAGLIVYNTATRDYAEGGRYRFLIVSTEDPEGFFPSSAEERPSYIHHEYAHGHYTTDESYQYFAQWIWTGLERREEELLLKVLSPGPQDRYCKKPEDPSCCEILADETFAYALAEHEYLLVEGLKQAWLTEEEAEEAYLLFRELRTYAEQVLSLLRRD